MALSPMNSFWAYPSQMALAAAIMLMLTWWAMVQRTASALPRQRPGVKSRASIKP